MPHETFDRNLLRLVAASIYFQTALTASREMFGRSYFSLGAAEKAAVDQAVLAAVGGNYQQITAEWLAGQQAMGPVGFQVTPGGADYPSPTGQSEGSC